MVVFPSMRGGATPTRRRRLRFLSSFLIMVFFVWVVFCQHRHQAAAAARTFPANQNPEQTHIAAAAAGSKEKLLRKYFNGRSFSSRGFQENKRTVPSCPDPLHN